VYLDETSNIAINKEVYNDEVISELKLKKENLIEKKAVEVGNIFSLGTKFSTPFDLKYKDENGEEKLVMMGSYGIGLGRLMGTVVEVLSDDKGMVWPETIAPYTLHLLALGDDEVVMKEAEKTYEGLAKAGVEVLFDDRAGISAGEKFSDADLLGMPYRAVISPRSIKEGGIELKKRTEEKGKIVSLEELLLLVPKA
jgi:prolyl-tRNA synthetase